MSRNSKDHCVGCIVGGAVGDALGWPVEFDDIDEIREEYGHNGISDPVPGDEELFEITDDTQMTLFTAEGLLRAWTTARHWGTVPDFTSALMVSYDCWLQTQDRRRSFQDHNQKYSGWLLSVQQLHHRRAPGNTCLSALREGTILENGRINNTSKGCGGVMRAAPAGLLAARIDKSDAVGTARLAFEIGCSAAALTHGHPSGYYPAGVLASVIATIISGGSLVDGITTSLTFLKGRAGSRETVVAIHKALRLWRDSKTAVSPEAIETLGGGWTGEEALSIGLYCALVAGDDFAKGVRLAVNHSGDSDSTGSIAGNILGALRGEGVIPHKWMERLELRDIIRQIGADLYCAYDPGEQWLKKYPPLCV